MITTFCPRCGRENPFDNQFCGKCGTALLQPKPVESVASARSNGSEPPAEPEPDVEVERTIHGPSFLGLSDEPDLSSSYLLDEEPSSSHWGLYFFLLLLAAVGGLVWLQAGHGGVNRAHLADLWQKARARITQEKQEAAAVAPNANPGASENSNAPTPPAAANGAPAGAASNATVTPPPSPAQIQNAAEKQNVPAPAALTVAAAAVKPPSPAPKPRSRRRSAEDAAASPSLDQQNAALLADAQKYLNGAGVPQSCDRALANLREASDNRSVEAKSMLGGLYATGHCVPLDRAIAYHWFALALRQQPNNSYVSHDLEMLWNQMTPQEKQLAIRMTQ